jgi:putative aldouronate transport system permease protein
MIRKTAKNISIEVCLNVIFLALTLVCLLPLVLVFTISITDEAALLRDGYSFLPKAVSFAAYRFLFGTYDMIPRAYLITVLVSVLGTALSLLVISMFAYVLSRKDFPWRGRFSFIMFVTMLFSGGMVPWYLICKAIGLSDNLWALILPYAFNAWYCIIMRTFFTLNIPDAVIESGMMDGAGEYLMFFRIVLPLSLPGLATSGLFACLAYWNDWWLPLMLTTKDNISNIQFLLYRIMANVEAVTSNASLSGSLGGVKLPSESIRMAMCIITLGPIVLAYPFFQRYFIEGLTVGSVKG